MRSSGFLLLLLVPLAPASCSNTESTGEADPAPLSSPYERRFEQIADCVHLAYRPDSNRTPVEGNSVLVITERDIVVFDGGGAPVVARQILDYIRRVSASDVTYLVNSHAHLDHTGGNQEYLASFPDVEIVAGPGTRDYMVGAYGDRFAYAREIAEDPSGRRERGEAQIAEQLALDTAAGRAIADRLARYYRADIDEQSKAFRELQISPPNLELDGRMVLQREACTLEIAQIGYGKSPGDLILWLPEAKTVATGDILTFPIPYGFSLAPSQWLETLRELRTMDADRYIPGHGPVQEGTDYLDRVIALVETLLSEVTEAVESGADRDGALQRVRLEQARLEFTHQDPVLDYLFEAWFREPAVARAFDEIQSDQR